MIIEYEDFKVFIDCLAKLKDLHNDRRFKEADKLRKCLVKKGIKIGYLEDGKIKYSCQVRNDKRNSGISWYAEII